MCAAQSRGFMAERDDVDTLGQLTQPPRGEAAQRGDFPLAGEDTAFLFNLEKQVCCAALVACATACPPLRYVLRKCVWCAAVWPPSLDPH